MSSLSIGVMKVLLRAFEILCLYVSPLLSSFLILATCLALSEASRELYLSRKSFAATAHSRRFVHCSVRRSKNFVSLGVINSRTFMLLPANLAGCIYTLWYH